MKTERMKTVKWARKASLPTQPTPISARPPSASHIGLAGFLSPPCPWPWLFLLLDLGAGAGVLATAGLGAAGLVSAGLVASEDVACGDGSSFGGGQRSSPALRISAPRTRSLLSSILKPPAPPISSSR